MIYYGNELYHHGIKGQKWGERRYQNPDGSLTPEGREHYGYGKASMTKKEWKETKKQIYDRKSNLRSDVRKKVNASEEQNKLNSLEDERVKLDRIQEYVDSYDDQDEYGNRKHSDIAKLSNLAYAERKVELDYQIEKQEEIVSKMIYDGYDEVENIMQSEYGQSYTDYNKDAEKAAKRGMVIGAGILAAYGTAVFLAAK